jgi:hypothetical protein
MTWRLVTVTGPHGAAPVPNLPLNASSGLPNAAIAGAIA